MTLSSYLGTCSYKRRPFGLKKALTFLQPALDIIISGVRRQMCVVYLDDVVVFSRTHDEHMKHLDRILTLLRRSGTSLKLRKSFFAQSRICYVDQVISTGIMKMAQRSTNAIREFKFCRMLTQV